MLANVYFRQAVGSYLDAPRIHFAGQYRADFNTRNNFPCNYDSDSSLYEPQERNYQGTNEWEFVDTVVTAVIGQNGEEIPDSSLLGAKIYSNENKPFGKIVDIDVDFQLSSLYGLEFGLKYNNESLFVGKWSTSVIVCDLWLKMKCADRFRGDSVFGAQSTTRITNLVWSQSELINNFKAATKHPGATGDLSVSITLDGCSAHVSTIGRMYGTIGVSMANEPLNVGGERKMEPVDVGSLKFSSDHPCYTVNQEFQKPWMYSAPFKVDYGRKVLVADLGNALPRLENGNPLDLGTLYFGVLVNGVVQPFGEAISYTNANSTIWKHSGIIERSIGTDIASCSNLQSSKLVVFIDSGATTGSNTYQIKEIFPSLHNSEFVSLLLSEPDYFIRPMDYFMDRLEYSSGNEEHSVKNSSDFTLLVTQFGKPVSNVNVTVVHSYNLAGQPVLPYGAVAPTDPTKATDINGHVTFTFTVNHPMPENRIYAFDTCSDYEQMREVLKHTGEFKILRRKIDPKLLYKTDIKSEYNVTIDGNLYNFYYCVGENCTLPDDGGLFLLKPLISILAFSTMTYKKPYTWVDHVEPIFKQVHHLHYVMRAILDMSNYTEVTLPHNIELLKRVLRKPIYDPNHMPVTRDLSPTKRQMILTWLDDPIFSKFQSEYHGGASVCNTSHLVHKMRRVDFSHFHPPRCLLKNIPFDIHPEAQDSYFRKIVKDKDFFQNTHFPPRALFGLGFDKDNDDLSNIFVEHGYIPVCNITTLQEQLQTAVLLEFSVLPLYLTAMYSIVENCNADSYQTIRDIVMQEMLHFVQVANILIAVGGKVIIDDPNFVPSYPSTGLPGGVLPGLDVSLEKFNLRHVYDTMMAIELFPGPESTLYTIGQLYKEILLCLHTLGDSIFDPVVAEHQVPWPWTETDNVGTLYIIRDEGSVQTAINQIIEQSGDGPLSRSQAATGNYGHFYRFEEIVCQRRLIQTEGGGGYAYAGAPIDYNPAGVYPMRDNPSSDEIVPNTNCYTQAKAFHGTYRSFLRVLQETFNGEPHKIHESVELMEALQLHAKKCIWTAYGEGNTCGPVWDYDW